MSSNVVEDVDGLDALHELEELWLNDNNIASLEQLEPAACSSMGSSLACLYISGNPCMSACGHSKVLGLFPKLQQVNDEMT